MIAHGDALALDHLGKCRAGDGRALAVPFLNAFPAFKCQTKKACVIHKFSYGGCKDGIHAQMNGRTAVLGRDCANRLAIGTLGESFFDNLGGCYARARRSRENAHATKSANFPKSRRDCIIQPKAGPIPREPGLGN